MKTKTTHTPGPWKLLPLNPFIFDSQEKSVALVDQKENSLEENMANARLIAAAPELLEALKSSALELKWAIKWMEEHNQMSEVVKTQRWATVRKAETVVSKAEGK